jgi:hypothetical protein
MHFVGLNARAQRCIDLLVPLNQALAFKAAGDNRRVPVLAVTRQFDVLAWQAAGDERFKFFTCHMGKVFSSRGRGSGFARPQAQRPLGGRELHEVNERGGIIYVLIL